MKLPADTFEGWLKTQTGHPGKAKHPESKPTDSYEKWIEIRVQKKA
jgi:hypothetical protein